MVTHCIEFMTLGEYMKLVDLEVELHELFRDDIFDICWITDRNHIRVRNEEDIECTIERTSRPNHFTLRYSGILDSSSRPFLAKVIKTLRKSFKTRNYNLILDCERDYLGEAIVHGDMDMDLQVRNRAEMHSKKPVV